MRRYLPSSAVNDPVSAWGYTRAMMTKRILTICAVVSAALAAGVAGTSLASAQSYPIPPGAVYSPNPPPYPPGGYSTDYRAPRPMDFDVLEDDDGPNRQSSTALPPPGPVPSPRRPPLWPSDGGAAGLFRSHCTDGPDPFARRPPLWPSGRSSACL